jgi:hypothetical protein
MLVHLFRGPGRIFGATEDETGANLPSLHAPWTPFRSLDLNRGDVIPGLNPDECLDDIAAHGHYLTDAHVRITGRDRD